MHPLSLLTFVQLEYAEQSPITAFAAKTVVLATVCHREDLRDPLTASYNGSQPGVDKIVRRALKLDASWVGAHTAAKADCGNVNWAVNGSLIFHIRTPLL